jgi:hypothetical protein
MIRKDGLIIPDNVQNVNLHILFAVGVTDDMRVGFLAQSPELWAKLNGLNAAMKQEIRDALITSVTNSLNKRLHCVINVS